MSLKKDEKVLKNDSSLKKTWSEEEQERKQRVIDAMAEYSRRQSRTTNRKNKKPEEAVVKLILQEGRRQGFFLNRYESKFKKVNGRWQQAGVIVGHPDISGVTPEGHFAAIEVKAPGKRNTLRPDQLTFLTQVIKRGGFGICADSWEYVENAYELFRVQTITERRRLLRGFLPKLAGTTVANLADDGF